MKKLTPIATLKDFDISTHDLNCPDFVRNLSIKLSKEPSLVDSGHGEPTKKKKLNKII